MLLHQAGARFGLVLGAFDGAQESVVTAGHQQQQALGRPAEGRHKLGAVLDGEPPRGAGAGVDETPAPLEPALDGQRCVLERPAGAMHRGDRGELALDHGIEDVRRAPQLDRGIAGTGTFGFHQRSSAAAANARDPLRVLRRSTR